MTYAKKKYLLVVGGPTASGKTALAIQLAQHFSTVILSADSRQFYEEMRIGNARPTEDERSSVQHYYVADRSVQAPLSAGAFAREALQLLEELFQDHDFVVLVGGSGLFVRALTEGLDDFPTISVSTRAQVDELSNTGGIAALQQALLKADPAYFSEVDQQNPARLKRALEVYYQTGKPYSSYRQSTRQERSFTPIYLQPHWPREFLYQRINRRVEIMLDDGLEAEARSLQKHQELAALQTVGYQEWWPYFEGDQTLDRTVELIQQNSRRYAKRQLTWNRRDGYWKLIPQGDLRPALSYVHLVTSAQLSVASFPVDQRSAILHAREDKKRLGLLHADQHTISAVADMASWKEWMFLRFWFDANLEHNGAAVLLHEACYRSDAECVYTHVQRDKQDQLLGSLGWRAVKPELEIPDFIAEQYPRDQIRVWVRSEQAF